MNTAGHPKRGMIDAATNPPTAAPSENPQIIVVTAVPLRRCGMYSEVSAMAFGIAPPMPSPVRKRKPASASIDCAVAVSSEPTPKISAHPMSTGRRPELIGKRTAHHRADHHPHESARDHRPEHAAWNLHRRAERGRDVAHRLRIEPVYEDDERAHRRDHQLVAADGLLVDELADVEGGRGRHRCALYTDD